jgi:hypothetical protein
LTKRLWFHAVSKLDGSDSDGIHLLWSPPLPAGYSMTGFDIQCKPHADKGELHCHTLTPNELAVLYSYWQVGTPLCRVLLRSGRLPDAPSPPQDEPWQGIGGDTAQTDGRVAVKTPSFFADKAITPATRLRLGLPSSLLNQLKQKLADKTCLVYEFALGDAYRNVFIEIGTSWALGIGLRERRR